MRRGMARVAPAEMLVGADDSVRPGPITQHLVGQGPCALPWVREKPGRADVGSELSAASGRGSEVSEWPRSKF